MSKDAETNVHVVYAAAAVKIVGSGALSIKTYASYSIIHPGVSVCLQFFPCSLCCLFDPQSSLSLVTVTSHASRA